MISSAYAFESPVKADIYQTDLARELAARRSPHDIVSTDQEAKVVLHALQARIFTTRSDALVDTAEVIIQTSNFFSNCLSRSEQ